MKKPKLLEDIVNKTPKPIRIAGKTVYKGIEGLTSPYVMGWLTANAFLINSYVESQNSKMPYNFTGILSFPLKAIGNTIYFGATRAFDACSDLLHFDIKGVAKNTTDILAFREVLIDHVMNNDYIALAEQAQKNLLPIGAAILAGYAITRSSKGITKEIKNWKKPFVKKEQRKTRKTRFAHNLKQKLFADSAKFFGTYATTLGLSTAVLSTAKHYLNYLDYTSTFINISTAAGTYLAGGANLAIEGTAYALSRLIGPAKDVTVGMLTNETFQGIVHYIDKFPKEDLDEFKTLTIGTGIITLAGIATYSHFKKTQGHWKQKRKTTS